MTSPLGDRDVLTAGVAMLGRTGAADFQLRYCEEEEPVVWMAIASWAQTRNGVPGTYFEVGAAMNPTTAVLRLCELVVDGGQCKHCNRPSGLDADWQTTHPLDGLICWYVYDPEVKVFRRGCEGSTP